MQVTDKFSIWRARITWIGSVSFHRLRLVRHFSHVTHEKSRGCSDWNVYILKTKVERSEELENGRWEFNTFVPSYSLSGFFYCVIFHLHSRVYQRKRIQRELSSWSARNLEHKHFGVSSVDKHHMGPEQRLWICCIYWCCRYDSVGILYHKGVSLSI